MHIELESDGTHGQTWVIIGWWELELNLDFSLHVLTPLEHTRKFIYTRKTQTPQCIPRKGEREKRKEKIFELQRWLESPFLKLF